MACEKIKSARAIAIEVLNRCDPKRNYAGTILDRLQHNCLSLRSYLSHYFTIFAPSKWCLGNTVLNPAIRSLRMTFAMKVFPRRTMYGFPV